MLIHFELIETCCKIHLFSWMINTDTVFLENKEKHCYMSFKHPIVKHSFLSPLPDSRIQFDQSLDWSLLT